MGSRPIRNLRILWLGCSAVVFSFERGAAARVDPVRPDRVPGRSAPRTGRCLGPDLSSTPTHHRCCVAGHEPDGASPDYAFFPREPRAAGVLNVPAQTIDLTPTLHPTRAAIALPLLGLLGTVGVACSLGSEGT